MRILISGGRDYDKGEVIYTLLAGLKRFHEESGPDFDGNDELVLIEGEARGADTLARKAGELLGYSILPFPAKWGEHGKAAGPIRNQQMLDEGHPDVVFCFHDDLENSKGTGHMAKAAKKAGVPVYNIRKL